MKTVNKSIGLWLLVMTTSLVLAYWASIPAGSDAGQRSTQSFVIEAMERLELSFGGAMVEAVKESVKSPRWWITMHAIEPTDGGGQAQDSKRSRFLASDKFTEYLRMIATFPVMREIGVVAEDKLNSFGLDAPGGSLIVKNDLGSMVEFSIGKQPYGARSYYVMRRSDKKVFLVSSDIIDDFLKPEARFFERRVSEEMLDASQSITISMPGKTRTFIRLSQSDSRSAQWAEKGSQTPVPAIGTWVEKFSEIKAASYADEAVRQSLSGRTPDLTVQFIDKKGNTHSVTMFTVAAADKQEYFLVSDFLGWPVKVASARSENLLKDAQFFFQN